MVRSLGKVSPLGRSKAAGKKDEVSGKLASTIKIQLILAREKVTN